jgi:hypothetical protein
MHFTGLRCYVCKPKIQSDDIKLNQINLTQINHIMPKNETVCRLCLSVSTGELCENCIINHTNKLEESKYQCIHCKRDITANDRNIMYRLTIKTGDIHPCHRECCLISSYIGSDIRQSSRVVLDNMSDKYKWDSNLSELVM